MRYSVILILEEERHEFHKYIETLYEVFLSRKDPFEVIIVANGAEGFLISEVEKIACNTENLRTFLLNKRTTHAVCLNAGFKESSGSIIVVGESYQQISKESMAKMLDAMDDDSDIVNAWRVRRVDPASNQFQSRLFNNMVMKITKTTLHDLSCTFRVIRSKVLEEVQLYGNMYRFLPILASQKGFRNKEVQCEHYQEHGKTGFYGFSQYLTRLIDIFTLYFTSRFSRKPLRFFSSLGLIFAFIGALIISYVFAQKIFLGYPIGGRPVLLLAILFLVLGVQAASVGLLGEIIAFVNGRQIKEYNIEKII